MRRTATTFQIESVPLAMQPYLQGAAFYDSSCSKDAQTYFIANAASTDAFLKISRKGTLVREAAMTAYIHQHKLAPKVIAFDSDEQQDFLLTEALKTDEFDDVFLDAYGREYIHPNGISYYAKLMELME
ncbi:hypothetical protein A8990_107144 [Paenibacillus taihuensis]|uniref:Uncharacterized protein n=1 Tax=Paenibacillus taihuensis TaxID=1156355 RepID=A0A3D9SCJ7_9BACL|nr:hypothetical protein [Paenibacillus taihuensis]REE89048.1 hypothetical protein A8990_107144 [Paenibacillus taihuensis]